MSKRNLVSTLVSVVAAACVGSGGLSLRASALQSAPPRSQPRFACTEVLGFSQSMQWYGASAFGRLLTGQPIEFELLQDVFLPAWQGRFSLGGAVEVWANPQNDPWDGHYRSKMVCQKDHVERVVFVVSGAAKPVDEWARDISTVAAAIRSRYPAERIIVMQPVTAADPGQCSNVRAVSNQASIVAAIERVAAASAGKIMAGPVSRVASCSQFSDLLGHLTDEGAKHVQQQLREFYSK